MKIQKYDMEISTADRYNMWIPIADYKYSCRLPLPTAELSLKQAITKISGKYPATYVCVCISRN